MLSICDVITSDFICLCIITFSWLTGWTNANLEALCHHAHYFIFQQFLVFLVSGHYSCAESSGSTRPCWKEQHLLESLSFPTLCLVHATFSSIFLCEQLCYFFFLSVFWVSVEDWTLFHCPVCALPPSLATASWFLSLSLSHTHTYKCDVWCHIIFFLKLLRAEPCKIPLLLILGQLVCFLWMNNSPPTPRSFGWSSVNLQLIPSLLGQLLSSVSLCWGAWGPLPPAWRQLPPWLALPTPGSILCPLTGLSRFHAPRCPHSRG